MADIFTRDWPLPGAKGMVVIAHGMAEHSGRYEHVAQALNAAGYAVHGFDHRGHGQSVGFPGDMGGDSGQLITDVADQVVAASAGHDKTFLLAHSMGTLFALPAANAIPSEVLTGLVLSGVAVAPGPAAIEAMSTGEGLPPSSISRDEAVVKAYVDDPLVFNEDVPPAMIERVVETIGKAVDAIPKVAVPVLLLHGTADLLTSIDGANMVYATLVIGDKTLQAYDGLYHEVLNEPEKDKVIADLVAWLDAH